MMKEKLFIWSVRVFLVLLPLQTHYIFSTSYVRGRAWQFGEISVYGIDILIALVCVFAIIAQAHWRPTARRTYVGVLTFLGLSGVSVLIHHAHAYNWLLLLRYIEGGLILFMLARVPDTLKNLLSYFVLGVFVSALAGVWQFISQAIPANSLFGIAEQIPSVAGVSVLTSSIGRFMRAYGSFPHPNIFGGYLAAGLLSLLLLVLRRSSHPKIHQRGINGFFLRHGWIFIAFPIIAALIFSFSRSAWMATAFAIVALCVVSLKRRHRHDAMIWTVFFVSVGIFITTLAGVLVPLISARIQVTESVERVSIADRQRSFADAGEILKKNWATGLGLGETTFYIAESLDPKREWWKIQPPHNIYVLIAIEASVFASLVFILLLLFLLWDAWMQTRKHLREDFPYATLSLAFLMLLAVIGLFDHYLITLPPGIFLLFTLLGLSMRPIDEKHR